MRLPLFFFISLFLFSTVNAVTFGISPSSQTVYLYPNYSNVFYFRVYANNPDLNYFRCMWKGPNGTYTNYTIFLLNKTDFADIPIYTNKSFSTGNGTFTVCYIPKENESFKIAPCLSATAAIKYNFSEPPSLKNDFSFPFYEILLVLAIFVLILYFLAKINFKK